MIMSCIKLFATISAITACYAFEWARAAGNLHSTNALDMNCKLPSGKPICCSMANDTNYYADASSRKNFRHISPSSAHERKSESHRNTLPNRCHEVSTYISSPYEIDQLQKATEFEDIKDEYVAFQNFTNFITSDLELNNSFLWVTRVMHRQRYPFEPASTQQLEIDHKYLSRFNRTLICGDTIVDSWLDWIEPISLHGRHPYSIYLCMHITKGYRAQYPQYFQGMVDYTPVQNTDYILMKTPHSNAVKYVSPSLNFLFDAGTSIYSSSLLWLNCIYKQHNITFDRIYGWESSLLEPTAFWNEVPKELLAKYHFYNAPMSADISHGNSPLRVIKQMAKPEDFVSFKLDIDTPAVEVATVLQLLENPELYSLVDEFFFELHFRCSVMMGCGWGKKIPKEVQGLQLSRKSAMELFVNLRKRGIRSHFWP